MYDNLISRFIGYAKENTRSDRFSDAIPSTPVQVDFLLKLKEELISLGLSDVTYNPVDSYLTATLPSNDPVNTYPTIGFIAHVDTADFNSIGVNPQIIENYDGGVIKLNEEYQLNPDEFPNLNNYHGQTLITTDGTTLLGADDKAGIAEIVTAVEYLIKNPEIKHGDVRVAFGPDEEIGRGADRFEVDNFACDFAYTMDGGPVGELQYESFNASRAVLTINGKNVHPGSAKDIMINAIQLAIDFHNQLPEEARPEKTEGREGFFHLLALNGEVDSATSEYIIRNHDRELFNQQKALVEQIVKGINESLGVKAIDLFIEDEYYNMAEVFEDDMYPVELAEKAMQALDIQVIKEPIRGGTDGSKLSFRGLKTPNIFAGGENMHGRFEYVALQSMEKATDVIIKIIELSKQ